MEEISLPAQPNKVGEKSPHLRRVLDTLQNKWTKFWHESEESYEKRMARSQGKLYGMGKGRRFIPMFNYDRVKLDPSYISEVIKPFAAKLKQTNGLPIILDLGAGKGDIGIIMKEMGLGCVNLDISSSGLVGKENSVVATSWNLPFPDNTFDGIHTKDMVTHIPRRLRSKFFSELYRVMKPEGIALICSASSIINDIGQYRVNQEELHGLAENVGFNETGVSAWKPGKKTKDWYLFREKRFILELKKTNEPKK